MVGIGISSASTGSDAVSLAKSSSRKSSSGDSSGFSDALSNSGSGSGSDASASSKTAADASADRAGVQDDTSQAQNNALQNDLQQAATSVTTASGKDVKVPTAPKTQGAGQSFAQALTAIPNEPPALPSDAALTTPATVADPANASAAEIAKQLAAIAAGDTSGQPVADAKGNLPTVKGDKGTATADDDTDADASDANAANGAISDTLSLLNAGTPVMVVPAQTAASVLAAAGQLHAGNGKVVPSTDNSTVGASTTTAAGSTDNAAAAGMAALTSRAASADGAGGGTAIDADGATPTVQVARANTKVQALDLAAGKNADEATKIDLKTAAGDATANITVLDSRRFVGLAEGSNSALVANALTGNKEWSAAMQPAAALTGASVTTSPSKVMNSLKIQMNPENLGTVTATMRLSGDQLSVDLKVQSSAAYRQLSNDQSAMIDSLRQQGYSVDRVTVTYAAPDTSSNSQGGSQSQQQQQQSGASQGQGGEAQSRKQNSGRQAGDQDDVWGTGTVGTGDSVAGGAQRAGAGGVYL